MPRVASDGLLTKVIAAVAGVTRGQGSELGELVTFLGGRRYIQTSRVDIFAHILNAVHFRHDRIDALVRPYRFEFGLSQGEISEAKPGHGLDIPRRLGLGLHRCQIEAKLMTSVNGGDIQKQYTY